MSVSNTYIHTYTRTYTHRVLQDECLAEYSLELRREVDAASLQIKTDTKRAYPFSAHVNNDSLVTLTREETSYLIAL